MRTPRSVLLDWIAAFNAHDAGALTALYAPDAVNHQVAEAPLRGREAIGAMIGDGFREFPDMGFTVLNLFEDGEWAMLEWHGWSTHRSRIGDPAFAGQNGERMHGCGFFHIVDGLIVFQRGYWDARTWQRLAGVPEPD